MNIRNEESSEWVISGHSGSLSLSKVGISGCRTALRQSSVTPVGLYPLNKNHAEAIYRCCIVWKV